MSPRAALPPEGPPATLDELLARASRLAGYTLGDLADALAAPLPEDLGRHKGFIGNLVERALGTTASTLPVPDFEALGVELKTIPTDERGRPKESTFVCTASLTGMAAETWSSSRVREKLAHVLFVPIESTGARPPHARRLGRPILFVPDDDEEAVLRADWEDLAELIAQGLVEAISARRGAALQLRPKARDAKVRRRARDLEGEPFATPPRGFYLRRSFTERALQKRMGLWS